MNTQVTKLRTLVLKELDPAYYDLNEQQINEWLREIPLMEAHIYSVLQAEVLGNMDNSLVERHLKQLQYDCIFLMDALYKYGNIPDLAQHLYSLTGACLQSVLSHIEERYAGCFKLKKDVEYSMQTEDYRIRFLLTAEGLAYFFKLLYKAGGLDPGPLSRMIISISKNFTTCGIGNGYLSSNSLMTKYKQVVQKTAKSVRALLVKMLKQLDEEFTIL